MKKMLPLSLAALMSAATLGVVTPAAAQQGYYDRDGYSSYYAGYDRDDRRYDRRYDRYDRRDYRNDRRYNRRGARRTYHNRCDNGTGGPILSAIPGRLHGTENAGRGAQEGTTDHACGKRV